MVEQDQSLKVARPNRSQLLTLFCDVIYTFYCYIKMAFLNNKGIIFLMLAAEFILSLC